LLLHVVVLAAASFSWLLKVEAVPEPPVTIRFYRAMPPTPRIESFHPIAEKPPLEALPEKTIREATPPKAPPPVKAETIPEPPPAEKTIAPVEPQAIAKNLDVELPAPTVAEHARPGSASGPVGPGSVDAYAPRGIALGSADSGLAQPRIGQGAPRAGLPGGVPGGQGRLPMTVGSFRGTAAGAETKPTAPKDGPADGGSKDPQADILGRRYSLRLVDARQLGQSTHDGWRYNQLVPLLSEAYRELAPRNGKRSERGAIDDDIVGVRVDPDAIQITYRDGTRHVLAPTQDGLVALYVSAGAGGHGKVEEAQRALGALRRLLQEGVRS
jgi:outer membrane biosynthesis protein TonB